MRPRIIIFCIIVAVICLWLVSRRSPERQNSNANVSIAMTTNTEMPSAVSSNENPAQSPPPQPSSALIAAMKYRASPEYSNEIRKRVMEDWHKPINFYGMVVDENSNPVSDATIQFEWSGFEDKSLKNSSTKSDMEGLFSLQGQYGRSLDVSVNKLGYYNSHKDKTSFLYSLGPDIYLPDSLNPVTFHLHKKGQGAELINQSFPIGFQIWQLHHDGTPIQLDLLNGSQNVNGNGQLKLELWRDLSNPKANKFDWKLQISVLGGGIIPTDEEFAFQAPQSNYQPSIVIDMPATNQIWLNELRTKYYVQLPDGNYGCFDFYLLPYNGVFTVHSAVNSSGSRNLEPAP